MGDTTSLVPGYPIRTSSDPRSVDSSPRHIAASHVLHRPLMPRHPPCALTHLQHTKHSNKNSYNQLLLLRCSQPLSTTQTPHPTTKQGDNPQRRVLPQNPTVCRWLACCCAPSRRHYSGRPLHGSHPTQCGAFFVVLLRKEVIQPHLPVRLPCYDFVPIADPTFDHSLPCGLGHGLRVLPTFMT